MVMVLPGVAFRRYLTHKGGAHLKVSSGESNGNPLQYPCLENLMDGGAW